MMLCTNLCVLKTCLSRGDTNNFPVKIEKIIIVFIQCQQQWWNRYHSTHWGMFVGSLIYFAKYSNVISQDNRSLVPCIQVGGNLGRAVHYDLHHRFIPNHRSCHASHPWVIYSLVTLYNLGLSLFVAVCGFVRSILSPDRVGSYTAKLRSSKRLSIISTKWSATVLSPLSLSYTLLPS